MSGMMDNMKTVNSVVRTLLALVVVGGLSLAGWLGYATYYKNDLELKQKEDKLAAQRQQIELQGHQLADAEQELADQQAVIADQQTEITRLAEDVRQKQLQIEKLDLALRLLKVDRRLARITVLDAGTDPDSGEPFSVVEFVEINDEGQSIEKPKTFRLRGDEVRVDCWLVKFDDQYIETPDELRSTNLCLFKSIYGNIDGPVNGHSLDSQGTRPTAYGRGSKMSDFEKKIWDDFWNIANNPEQASQLGIRAAHGAGSFTKALKGKVYTLQLRASDGITIPVSGDAPARSSAPTS